MASSALAKTVSGFWPRSSISEASLKLIVSVESDQTAHLRRQQRREEQRQHSDDRKASLEGKHEHRARNPTSSCCPVLVQPVLNRLETLPESNAPQRPSQLAV